MGTEVVLPMGPRLRLAAETRRLSAVAAPARRVWALAVSRPPRELESSRVPVRAARWARPVRWARPEPEPIDWRQALARPWFPRVARTNLAFAPAREQARRP